MLKNIIDLFVFLTKQIIYDMEGELMMRDHIGVIHGRFQMLHIGHMEYLLAGKERCEYLIIGISNPDISLTKYSGANPHRSTSLANPLTYYERFQMITKAMIESGVNQSDFDIVPFPINYPELLFNYVPLNAKFYMTIYDDWSKEKQLSLQKLGCDIDIMWTRTNEEKATSGTEVRNLIANAKPWSHLVPKSVFEYVTENEIDKRIINMSTLEDKNNATNCQC